MNWEQIADLMEMPKSRVEKRWNWLKGQDRFPGIVYNPKVPCMRKEYNRWTMEEKFELMQLRFQQEKDFQTITVLLANKFGKEQRAPSNVSALRCR